MTNQDPDPRSAEKIRETVRQGYGQIARDASAGSSGIAARAGDTARRIGYSDAEIEAAPEGANLGLGCGNPTAIDSLRPGEVVVDLGSGAGFDAFLAARQVGAAGQVIGVDMTDEMLERARANAETGGFQNVEFRKGRIEQLPIESESIDAAISNCVINLSPEKARVFSEAFRVLRPGGRLMISDVVLEQALPEAIANSVAAYVGCIGGAVPRSSYLGLIRDAGFREVKVVGESPFDVLPDDLESLEDPRATELVASIGFDPEDARRLFAQLDISLDALRGLLESVKSIRVHAVK